LSYFEHRLIIIAKLTMARPKCCRIIHNHRAAWCFGPKPENSAENGAIRLTLDECEALRLCDLLKMHHHEAADEMKVSRQTIGRILESAREKSAKAIIEGLNLIVAGGPYTMAANRTFRCRACNHAWEMPFGGERPKECPQCKSANFHREHVDSMPLSATQENGPSLRRRRGQGQCQGQGRGRRCRGSQA